ncbi:hypothetical protein BDW75DRAFT_206512 [Aspergillus navahoensis]
MIQRSLSSTSLKPPHNLKPDPPMSAPQEQNQSLPFTAHRPKSALLIPSKRPLSRPRPCSSASSPNSKHTAPTLTIRSAAPTEESKKLKREKEKNRIEADFSAAPQPFLDTGLWERVKDKVEWGT